MKLGIDRRADWAQLSRQRLTTVLDPMVLRCGELFLEGRSGAADPDGAWELLDRNLGALGLFFDRLILDERLPVFNYGDSFDAQRNFDQRALARINESEPVLVEVEVGEAVYQPIKDAALREVGRLLTGGPRIDPQLGRDVLQEMAAAEYDWRPDLGALETQLPSDDDRRLATFFVGGLLFGGYAQTLDGDHLLQPKRARLFVAAALQARSADFALEEALFKELKSRAVMRCDDLPWTPTFFPYLLARADSPDAMVGELLSLRRSAEVADYRAWLAAVMSDWRRDGRIDPRHRRDVAHIAAAVDRRLARVPTLPRVEMKLTIADTLALKPPGGLDLGPSLQALWGWSLASLPGQRHRKLLSRAVADDASYDLIQRRVRTVWEAA